MNTNLYIALLVMAIVSAGCAAPSPEAEAANPEAPQVAMVPPEKKLSSEGPATAPPPVGAKALWLEGNKIYDGVELNKKWVYRVDVHMTPSLAEHFKEISIACQEDCYLFLDKGFSEPGRYHLEATEEMVFPIAPEPDNSGGSEVWFTPVTDGPSTQFEVAVLLGRR